MEIDHREISVDAPLGRRPFIVKIPLDGHFFALMGNMRPKFVRFCL
jgi:hypothetical protein